MDQKLRQQAVAVTEQIMRTYYSHRDIYAVLDRMAPDATWIGPGVREKIYTLEEMRAYFEAGRDAVPPCEVSNVALRAFDLSDDLCLVAGSMTIRTTPESGLLLKVDQRVSFTLRYTGGDFQVVHLHNSNPYEEMEQEEYFPHKIGSQSYQYLQQLLREKTEVLDMIAGNINGGLKGSNDDETFSYFYVNEGLPRMLGYPYEEFMKKSGGTAVGAVYPPDLPAALADCQRCFARGSVYSTEYRMEKKDGSLMWVLDSGRKSRDSQGVTRINSILTDITPLKQALFDLEVERERYRIALEHITGSMCEYDVAGDLFVVHQRSARGGPGVHRLELPRFSAQLRSGGLMDEAEGAAFLDLCTGRRGGVLEVCTALLHPEGSWCWAQFSCSVLLDHAGMPVRAIGMLKDITQERQRNQELMDQARHDGLTGLLNQTAAKASMQARLAEQESGVCLTLLIMDLDHFKDVNDCNGHLYGDEVLVKTARILEAATDDGSIVGRFGGDEFIALTTAAHPQAAAQLADGIVRQVRGIGADRAFPISCSVGIACWSGNGETFTQLFQRADRALYRAKSNGRDGYTIDGFTVPPLPEGP